VQPSSSRANSLAKVQVRHVPVIEGWLLGSPSGDVAHKLDLIGQRQDVIVASDVDVQDMELVLLAQVISEIDKRRAGCLGNAIVNHDKLLIKVVLILCGSRIEERQKVVCGGRRRRYLSFDLWFYVSLVIIIVICNSPPKSIKLGCGRASGAMIMTQLASICCEDLTWPNVALLEA